MARADQSPVDDLEPERRIARLFAQKHAITPPVPVESLIGKLADVEYASFPGSWDALLLTRPNARPKIVVSSDVTSTRRLRFTLAHEIGHLIIPWSVGAMFCHANASYHVDDDLLRTLEAEANRFASELLFPIAWVQQRLSERSGALADFVLKLADESQVSPIVAVLGMGRVCPPDTVLMIVSADGSIKYRSVAPRSNWSLPDRWGEDASREMRAAGALITSVDYDIGMLVAVELPQGQSITVSRPAGSSKDILNSILDDVCQGSEQKNSWRGIVRGIAGYAMSRSSSVSHAGICAVIRQRFVGREDLRAFRTHRLFDEFVEAAAYELAVKKSAR
ncbi:ImmA/IrrE family metallo-endopeptidase [Polyangium jinanense]|uniref:ImmA/IrrE family metallo-endopeptidase n=1 Tax=Polyangium jinanense TaxID=2829994 RepID=A0A9X3XIE4_9BACT|nr:ImmA/IrrE family metallo-endopeptidase [Polyangium jinanense]MDC3962869.1 ImmA/IrrE family metallo-endopeptidase [Polyangium jinanense]MDC3989253.1 ImmA/IrrE family metallo-endopeptidase [Polyangium jinanense]